MLAAHAAIEDVHAHDAAVLSEPSLVGYWRLDETTGAAAVDAKAGHHGTYKGGVTLASARWRH